MQISSLYLIFYDSMMHHKEPYKAVFNLSNEILSTNVECIRVHYFMLFNTNENYAYVILFLSFEYISYSQKDSFSL